MGVDRRVTELLDLDRRLVWHPYGQMPAVTPPFVVAAASGAELELAAPVAGRRTLVDGMSSWWAVIHGYRHPALDRAVTDQLGRMSHVMFGGLTHEPAVELCRRLVEVAPEGLEHVFLSDSGSVAMEVAMKMALQYQKGTGAPGRDRFLTWRGGYHGDTFLAMSVCDPDTGMHAAWSSVLPEQVFCEAPPAGFDAPLEERYVATLEDTARRSAGSLAGIIVEPVVQGAGGMRFHHPGYVAALRRIADELGVLLILDEIATGFGRTGRLFAAHHAGVSPDIMCVGKALTGGYLSLAATLCTPAVAAGIAHSPSGVLAHGPTFMGNPLATAVAGASLDLLAGQDWVASVRAIERVLGESLAPARRLRGVRDVRVLGAIGVVELDHDVDVGAATRAAARAGAWLRPFRNLVYAMPPFVVTQDQAQTIAAGVLAAAAAG